MEIYELKFKKKQSYIICGIVWIIVGLFWTIKSYCNVETNEKDLSEEQIKAFMDTINAK